jgi:hypothetical protein
LRRRDALAGHDEAGARRGHRIRAADRRDERDG